MNKIKVTIATGNARLGHATLDMVRHLESHSESELLSLHQGHGGMSQQGLGYTIILLAKLETVLAALFTYFVERGIGQIWVKDRGGITINISTEATGSDFDYYLALTKALAMPEIVVQARGENKIY